MLKYPLVIQTIHSAKTIGFKMYGFSYIYFCNISLTIENLLISPRRYLF